MAADFSADTFRQSLTEATATDALDAKIAASVAARNLSRCSLPYHHDVSYDDPEFREAVVLCIATLRTIARKKRTGVTDASDYFWKHQAESLSAKFGERKYVPRAAMIVAADVEDIDVFEYHLRPQTNGGYIPSGSLCCRAGHRMAQSSLGTTAPYPHAHACQTRQRGHSPMYRLR